MVLTNQTHQQSPANVLPDGGVLLVHKKAFEVQVVPNNIEPNVHEKRKGRVDG